MICARCGERPATVTAVTERQLVELCDPCGLAVSWEFASQINEQAVQVQKGKYVHQGPTIVGDQA